MPCTRAMEWRYSVCACVFIPGEGTSGYVCPTEGHEAPKDPPERSLPATVPLVLGLWSPSLWRCVLAILWEGPGGRDSVTWTPAVWIVRPNLLTQKV